MSHLVNTFSADGKERYLSDLPSDVEKALDHNKNICLKYIHSNELLVMLLGP